MTDKQWHVGKLLAAALLVAGLAARAYTSDITSSGTVTSGSVELSSTSGILGGALGDSTVVPAQTEDALTATLGIRNVLLDTEFNIFNVSPAQMTEWGTAYGEVWNGAGSQWGGATVGLPLGRLGVFLGRPYAGIANGVGQSIGTALAGTADASATPSNTGIQNGANGAWLPGTLTSDPAGSTGHALYDQRVLAPRNMIDLLYGIPFGDNLSVGIGYAYATNKDEESWSNTRITATTPNTAGDGSITNERKTKDHQVSIGALLKNVGPLQKVDVALNFGMPSVDNKHAETALNTAGGTAKSVSSTFESDGAKSIGFLLRSILGMGEKNKLVAAFTYNRPIASSKGTFRYDDDGDGTYSSNASDISRSWTTEDKASNIRIDAAFHQQPTDALKVIYALGYVRTSSERTFALSEGNTNAGSIWGGVTGVREQEKREETLSALPLALAVEHQTFSKVATRFGIQKTLFGKNKIEVTDATNRIAGGAFVLDQTSKRTTEIDSSIAATATLGLGIKPTKDVEFDIGLVSTLFDLDAGAGVSDIISRASLRYHF